VGTLRRTIEDVRRFRTNFVFFTLLLLFVLLLGRLGKLQLVDGAHYQELARSRHMGLETFGAMRGQITDRFGWPLAFSRPLRRVAIDPHPQVIPNVWAFARGVSAVLGDDPPAWRIRALIDQARADAKKTGPDGKPKALRRYISVRSRIADPLTVQRLDTIHALSNNRKASLDLYGLIVEKSERREWPNGDYAVHPIGKPPVDGSKRRTGIEGHYDTWLRGKRTCVSVVRDNRRRAMAMDVSTDGSEARGKDVRLTLDLVIQHQVESELDRIVQTFEPTAAFALVLDVRTGEILGWANRPTYDPNRRIAHGEVVTGEMDWVTQGRFEFGSIFKAFTVAWALENGIVDAQSTVPMPLRLHVPGMPPINDSHAIGDGTVALLLEQSSNTGAAWLGQQLGAAGMQTLWERLRFDQPTGVGFSYEAAGRIAKGGTTTSGRWLPWLALRSAFGQGIAITPLQCASAFAALARADGYAIRPTIVMRGKPRDPRVARLCSPEHISVVREGLRRCVQYGTLREPFAGCAFPCAGKTGTSQQRERGVEWNIASVCAFAPADDPEVLVLVSARVAKNRGSGASVSGLAARRLLESTLHYWHKQPAPTSPMDAGGPRLGLAHRTQAVWSSARASTEAGR
jgi:cell division protein FtsI/penicillin-binding protein 2